MQQYLLISYRELTGTGKTTITEKNVVDFILTLEYPDEVCIYSVIPVTKDEYEKWCDALTN